MTQSIRQPFKRLRNLSENFFEEIFFRFFMQFARPELANRQANLFACPFVSFKIKARKKNNFSTIISIMISRVAVAEIILSNYPLTVHVDRQQNFYRKILVVLETLLLYKLCKKFLIMLIDKGANLIRTISANPLYL